MGIRSVLYTFVLVPEIDLKAFPRAGNLDVETLRMVTEALRGFPWGFNAWWADRDKLDDPFQFLGYMCVGEETLIVLCFKSRHLSALLLFGMLTRSSSFLIQVQCDQWEHVLRGNVATPSQFR